MDSFEGGRIWRPDPTFWSTTILSRIKIQEFEDEMSFVKTDKGLIVIAILSNKVICLVIQLVAEKVSEH